MSHVSLDAEYQNWEEEEEQAAWEYECWEQGVDPANYHEYHPYHTEQWAAPDYYYESSIPTPSAYSMWLTEAAHAARINLATRREFIEAAGGTWDDTVECPWVEAPMLRYAIPIVTPPPSPRPTKSQGDDSSNAVTSEHLAEELTVTTSTDDLANVVSTSSTSPKSSTTNDPEVPQVAEEKGETKEFVNCSDEELWKLLRVPGYY